MSLAPGTRLGPYEVTGQIGVGGMGEVYRGRDATLNRDVAIKVLPAALASDTERLARFKREAQVLASLNHPNIAHVYSFEQLPAAADGSRPRSDASVEGRPRGSESPGGEKDVAPAGAQGLPREAPIAFLVMEFVEGEDLAERLKRGAIPADEAIPLAKQIAEGLEDAHEHGIIHRDLKPANIKLTTLGKVKILDFGLAKALEGDPASSQANSQLSHSPTMSRHMTEAGMIMGTAAYMSPEQARGKTVDKRADIWSFGVVLFEMLTGTRLFAGETVSDTLASVLREEVPWDRLPKDTPPHVTQVLKRCLTRDAHDRLRDIGDARMALMGAFETLAPQAATATTAMPRGPMQWAAFAFGVVALLTLGVAAALYFRPPSPTDATTRLSVMTPANRPIALGWSPGRSLAVSPDGTHVVYVGTDLEAPANRPGGRTQLQVRSLATLAVRDLPGTTGALQPFFSPDGQWIAFFTWTGELKKVFLAGGTAVTLLSKLNAAAWAFGVWTEDNTIVFSTVETGTGLRRISAEGGAVTDLTSPDAAQGERLHLGPSLVPSSRGVLFWVIYADLRDPRIDAVMLDSGQRLVVLENAGAGPVLSSGHLLFKRNDTFLIAPFDMERLIVTGPGIPLADDVRRDGESGLPELAVSSHGTLAYIPATDTAQTMGLVGRDGTFEPLGPPPGNFDVPRVSPDGRSIAYVAKGEVYVYDLARGSTTKLTQDGQDGGPAWRPDGRSLAIISNRKGVNGIFLKNLDGTERLLVPLPASATSFRQPSWSPDGTRLAYTIQTGSLHDIWILTTGDKPTSQPILTSAASEYSPRFSPDGQWLAYVSDESGRSEVYVRGFPQGDRFAVSASGGNGPVWGRDGKALFFEGNIDGAPKLMTASVTRDGVSLLVGKPLKHLDRRVPGPTGVIEQYAGSGNSGTRYDVLPDGRFVMIRGAVPSTAREIVVVQHWFEELKRLVPTR